MDTEPTKPEDLTTLYRRAFAKYRARALWNKRMFDEPTPEAALVIARALRIEGDRNARILAEQIERACNQEAPSHSVETTRADSDTDETFRCIVHPVNLAINKVIECIGRRNARDVVDLVAIHETILSLGAVIWAAADQTPGFTPEGLIAEIRRTMHYPKVDWDLVTASEPIDAAGITRRLRAALDEAEQFVLRMPTEKMGLLFLKDGKVVQPDPDRLGDYQTHAGRRRGQWPSSPEIEAAMLEHYTKSPISENNDAPGPDR